MSNFRIDHIGVIVTDLEKAIDRFRILSGGEPAYTKELQEVGLRIATFEAENIAIELIEYNGPQAQGAKTIMGEDAGLNHISIGVDDISVAISEMTAAGFEIMADFPRAGAHGQVAFFKPDDASGLLFEICQHDPSSD